MTALIILSLVYNRLLRNKLQILSIQFIVIQKQAQNRLLFFNSWCRFCRSL